MFGKKKQIDPQALYDQSYAQAMSSIGPQAVEWAAMSPATFPDGSSYPAGMLLNGLAEAFAAVAAANMPDRIWQLITVQMAEVRDVANGKMDVGVIDALYQLRQELETAGCLKEALALAEAGQAVHRYREQSGTLDAFLDQQGQ